MIKGRDGFSLIELLVVMGVGSVIGVMLITMLVQNNGLFYQQNTRSNQGISLNDVTTEIIQGIRNASSIASSYPATDPEYTSSANTLVLSMVSLSANGEVIDNTYDFLVISPDAQKPTILRRRLFPNSASSRKAENKVLLTNLSLLQFVYKDKSGVLVSPTSAAKVNVILNIKDQIGINSENSSSSAEVSLRND